MLISKNKIAMVIIILILILLSALVLLKKPSHERDWELGQEKLAQIEIKDSRVVINNFRDFTWRKEGVAEINYSQENFNLDKIQGVDVAISHFAEFEGMAHAFIVFRFSDNRNVAVSVETRREKGEKFSPWLGLFREFEIIYVVGSEKDMLGLRTDIRQERVYLYPTVADSKAAKMLFFAIARDINNIYSEPTFYNTLFNNCTNAITKRVAEVFEIKFPITYKTLFPGFMDEILYQMKLIPTDKSFLELKNYYQIDNNKVDSRSDDYWRQLRTH
ncbi:MAG: DUF4105 domain-containing protein [Candidatus Moraniibacteriota bacterium]